MIFPFVVRFNKRLSAVITSDNEAEVLWLIKKSILADKADHVIAEDLHVSYKGSASNWRGSLFQGVDNGVFTLIYKDNSWWLNYQIDMRKMFIWTAVISACMAAFVIANSGPWWIGVIAFLWLCGANWVTKVLRHGSLNTDIGHEIDELICGKKELPEQDNMAGNLKSWF